MCEIKKFSAYDVGLQGTFVEAAKDHVRAIHRPHDRPDIRPVGHVLNIADGGDERAHLAVGMRLAAAHAVLTYVEAVEDLVYAYYDHEYVVATEGLHAAVQRGDWKAMVRKADRLLASINEANQVAYYVDFRARAAAFPGGDEGRDYDTPAMRYLESLRQ